MDYVNAVLVWVWLPLFTWLITLFIEQRFRKGEGKPEGDHKAAILQRRSKRRVVYRVLILVTLLGNVAFNIWFFYVK